MTFKPKFTSLPDIYAHSISQFGGRPLFGTKSGGTWKWMTYREFGEAVDAMRGALTEQGIGKGDRVAIISNNRPEWAVAAYATYGIGGAFVPMYESQLPKDWEYILKDCGAKVLFVPSAEIADQITPLRSGLPDLQTVVVLDGSADGTVTYASLLSSKPVPMAEVTSEDIAGYIYTSGTTGNPKGVLLSHGNIASNVSAIHEFFPMSPEDRSLSFLPWAHSFGQTCELHGLFSMGASMGIAEAVDKIVANLAEVRPSLLFSVPRIFNRIYDGLNRKMAEDGGLKLKLFEGAMSNAEHRKKLSDQRKRSGWADFKQGIFDKLVFSKVRDRFGGRLKYAFSGGAALSREVAEFVDNLGIMVYEGYGLTETSPLISVNIPGARKIGSVGRPMPGVKVTIKDVEGYDEGIGEICVRGKNVMEGYHGLPEKTAEVLDEGGELFHTGDLGSLDEDGFLWILGRVKEQYKLENGKYVVPAPIEEQLALSPYITQCMIEGTNKPHNVAVIVVDRKELEAWGGEQGVPKDELLTHKKVRELIASEIKKAGSEVKSYERPKDFILTDEEWTTENGMLTPKMSLKRREVMKKYGDELEKLF